MNHIKESRKQTEGEPRAQCKTNICHPRSPCFFHSACTLTQTENAPIIINGHSKLTRPTWEANRLLIGQWPCPQQDTQSRHKKTHQGFKAHAINKEVANSIGLLRALSQWSKLLFCFAIKTSLKVTLACKQASHQIMFAIAMQCQQNSHHESHGYARIVAAGSCSVEAY